MICSDKNCHFMVVAIVFSKKKLNCQLLSIDCVFLEVTRVGNFMNRATGYAYAVYGR